MIKKLLFYLFLFLVFQSCEFKKTANKPTKMLRYSGNNKYTTLKKPIFYRGERIFFKVPIYDFINCNEFGNFLFSYKIEIKDAKGKSVYHLDGGKQSFMKGKVDSKNPYMTFFYDSFKRQKKGNYTFIVKLIDLNWQNKKEFKKLFVLK